MSEGEVKMLILYELPDEPGTFAIDQPYASTEVGEHIRIVVGEDNPYYAFANNTDFGFDIWDGYVANWTGAPICSSSATTNNNNILQMLDTPPVDKISPPA